MQIGISCFFGVADFGFPFIFLKLKMADPIWRKRSKNYPMLIKIGM